jgi:hypothetical protein
MPINRIASFHGLSTHLRSNESPLGCAPLGVVEKVGVGLLSPNEIYYYVLGDGAIAAGATFIGIPPLEKQDQLARHIEVA